MILHTLERAYSLNFSKAKGEMAPSCAKDEVGSSVASLPSDALFYIATLLEQSPTPEEPRGSVQQLRSFTEVCKSWRVAGRAAARRLVLRGLLAAENEVIHKDLQTLETVTMSQYVRQMRVFFPNADRVCFRGRGDGLFDRIMEFLIGDPCIRKVELKHIEIQSTEFLAGRTVDLPVGLFAVSLNLESLALVSFNASLRGIPEEIGEWTCLKQLELGHLPQLTRLPSSVGDWSKLTSCKISMCNALQELPKEVAQWVNLREFCLGSCRSLEELPSEVRAWKRLEFLALNNAKDLEGFPVEVGAWRCLRKLALSGLSRMTTFPETSCEWTNLTSLDVFTTNKDGFELSSSIVGAWKRLRYIRYIGESTGSCEGSSKPLRLLPDSRRTLLPESRASWGDQISADLSRIGDPFQKWQERLERVRAGIRVSGLTVGAVQEVNALPAAQGITSLPAVQEPSFLPDEVSNWGQLRKIVIVSCDALLFFPNGVAGWTLLEKIRIVRCRHLETLPATVAAWKKLTSVHISGCPSFRRLPDSVKEWESLEILKFRGLPIEGLPRGIGTGLWASLQRVKVEMCPKLPYETLSLLLKDWKHLEHVRTGVVICTRL